MKKRIKQAAKLFGWIFAAFLVLLQIGCKNQVENLPLLWYTGDTLSIEASFVSEDGRIFRMTGSRSPTAINVSVTEPASIAGLRIFYQNGNCVISAGEAADGEAPLTTIPLSKAASAGLSDCFDALLLDDPAAGKLGSDDEGNPTLTVEGQYTITFDSDGLPAKIALPRTNRTVDITVSAPQAAAE